MQNTLTLEDPNFELQKPRYGRINIDMILQEPKVKAQGVADPSNSSFMDNVMRKNNWSKATDSFLKSLQLNKQ